MNIPGITQARKGCNTDLVAYFKTNSRDMLSNTTRKMEVCDKMGHAIPQTRHKAWLVNIEPDLLMLKAAAMFGGSMREIARSTKQIMV